MITAMEDRIKARQDVVELETILAELNLYLKQVEAMLIWQPDLSEYRHIFSFKVCVWRDVRLGLIKDINKSIRRASRLLTYCRKEAGLMERPI